MPRTCRLLAYGESRICPCIHQGCRCALCACRSAAPATRKLRWGARPVRQGFSSPTEPAPCLCPPRWRSRRAADPPTSPPPGAFPAPPPQYWQGTGECLEPWDPSGAGTAFRSDIQLEHQEIHFQHMSDGTRAESLKCTSKRCQCSLALFYRLGMCFSLRQSSEFLELKLPPGCNHNVIRCVCVIF